MKPYSQKILKPWGYELILTPDYSPVVGKMAFTKAGKRWSYQFHDQKIETICLIKGKAKLVTEEKEIPMIPLKGYFIKPNFKHRFWAITDCVSFEFSTPEKGNTIRLEDDYCRPTETEEVRKSPDRGWKAK
jgi:hypothetical protein